MSSALAATLERASNSSSLRERVRCVPIRVARRDFFLAPSARAPQKIRPRPAGRRAFGDRSAAPPRPFSQHRIAQTQRIAQTHRTAPQGQRLSCHDHMQISQLISGDETELEPLLEPAASSDGDYDYDLEFDDDDDEDDDDDDDDEDDDDEDDVDDDEEEDRELFEDEEEDE